jgi:thiol:disulfide interchange protein
MNMRRILIPVVILSIALSSFYVVFPKTKKPMSSAPSKPLIIKWNKDYSAALAQAKSQHKMIMIDFYTSWCEWCKKLDTDVYPDPKVITAVSKFAPVKLDAEKGGSALAEKYGVTGYPTIVFITADGTLVSKIVGYEDSDQFARDANRVSGSSSDSVAMAAPKNTEVPPVLAVAADNRTNCSGRLLILLSTLPRF